MQAIAANQAAKNMAEATQREMDRQQGFRNEAFGTLQGFLPQAGVEQARTDITKGTETRKALFDFLNSLQMGPGHPGAQGRDLGQLKLRGNARATLGGYSDWALDRLVRQIRTQNELNRVSNFAAGTAGVFPYRMYDAQHSMDELAFWGQLIQSLGGSGGGQFGSSFGGGGAPGVGAGFGGFAGGAAGFLGGAGVGTGGLGGGGAGAAWGGGN